LTDAGTIYPFYDYKDEKQTNRDNAHTHYSSRLVFMVTKMEYK